MLIDFHAHVFPDKLAKGAVASLAAKAHFTPYTDGTLAETRKLMKEQGVDVFVALNIAVSPRTERSVNDFAISLLQEEGVVPFGSVHPYSENAFSELERLKKAGIQGIKFHNEYQDVYVDDARAEEIYRACAELGLIMLFHGGADRGFLPPIKTTPERMRRAIDKCPEGKFVVAHLGGQDMVGDSVRYLADSPAYIDVSFASKTAEIGEAEDCIRAFGAERVLFGTDCPWDTPAETTAYLRKMRLSDAEREAIFYKNALGLLEKA